MKKIIVLLTACVVLFAACTPGSGSNSGGNGGGGTPASAYMGTKAPDMAKEVGDIVFNDGSATPYTDELTLTDAQKNAAIAIIFYKGTGLNSGDDTTTSRTLGVGVKQNKTGLLWCAATANAYEKNITTIQCPASGSARALTFTGDKNGSDNLEQIGDFEGVNDTSGTGAKDLYPAFYFAKNYLISDSEYASGWYLPSIAELFQIYACMNDSENGVDINAASQLCGGDKFETERYYWSSSQFSSDAKIAYALTFYSGDWVPDEKSCDDNFGAKCYTCAIREF